MKKMFLLVALLFSFSTTAHALNTLQLGITGGTYLNETTVANGNVFDLNAYLLPNRTDTLGDTYYLSASLIRQGGDIGDSQASLGSFKIGSSTYSVTDSLVFGTPPVDPLYKDIPGHGIFPTWFLETAFTFDANSFINPAINVADAKDTQQVDMYLKTFAIDLSGLAAGYGMHFDLYTLDNRFAPPSHDAEGWNQPVPEPGTVLLLGCGFLGLAIYGRRRRNS